MAVRPLRALVAAGHDIALCVTRPDRRRGRGGAVTPSPVKDAALELGLPVSHSMEDVADAGVELAVVVAYGRIIPASLLERVPMVNLHFSLLPRWRGAAPVERAMLAGDEETGVCLMKWRRGSTRVRCTPGRSCPSPRSGPATLRDELVDGRVARSWSIRWPTGVAGLPAPVPTVGRAHHRGQADAGGPPSCTWEQPAAQSHRVVRLGRAWTTFRGQTAGDPQGDAGWRMRARAAARAGRPGTLVGTVVCHRRRHPRTRRGAAREPGAHAGRRLGPGCPPRGG